MLIFRTARRLGAPAVAAGAATALALALGVASPASAVAQGKAAPASGPSRYHLDVCAKAGYAGAAEYARTNLSFVSTPFAKPGRCIGIAVFHADSEFPISVVYRSHGVTRLLTQAYVNLSAGVTVDLWGSTGDNGKDARITVEQNGLPFPKNADGNPSPEYFNLCTTGNYAGEALFPGLSDGGLGQPRGTCGNIVITSLGDRKILVKLYGYWNSNGARFFIKTVQVNVFKGVTVDLTGSTADNGKTVGVHIHQNS